MCKPPQVILPGRLPAGHHNASGPAAPKPPAPIDGLLIERSSVEVLIAAFSEDHHCVGTVEFGNVFLGYPRLKPLKLAAVLRCAAFFLCGAVWMLVVPLLLALVLVLLLLRFSIGRGEFICRST